jgi:tetratricopeptide (TPR) repeat protein
MVRQFEPKRAVEVVQPKYGSAYRIGGRLVLTAAHLLSEVGSDCRLRSKQSFGEVTARVVWKAPDSDIALLELPEQVERCESVVFGRLPEANTGETLEFQMYGYPRWGRTQREQGTAAGGRQVEGLIYLADTSPDGLLVLEAQRLPPEALSESGSDWEGNSGAVIVCDGLVIAVQRQHQNPRRPASLEATPLWTIYDDEQWCDVLRQHGISLEPEIAAIARQKGDSAQGEQTGALTIPYFYPSDLGSSTFVGRGDELQDLHQLLQQSDRVGIAAVTGMGGVGKTELAWQYAQSHRADYPGGIWWLAGLERVSQILVNGQRMGLGQPPDTLESDRDQVLWVYDQWLKTIPDGVRLLILDDVPNYGAIRPLLPEDSRFRVLMTTREQFGKPVKRLDLGVLKRAAGFRLLQRLVDDDDRIRAEVAVAQALCEWVGRLPLGIELIGRHLASRQTLKLATLLERLESQRFQAAALRQVPSEMPYRDNLEAAFELSWQLLRPDAKTLGGMLSVFAQAPIAKEWVAACLPDWDEEPLEEAETALIQKSLLSLEEGQYLLHALIREFFRARLEGELQSLADRLRRGLAQALTAVAQTVPQTVTQADLARVQGAMPHWQVVAEQLTSLLEDQDALWPFVALGRVAAGQSRWQEAERWDKACLELAEQRFGTDHPATATSMNNLAALYDTTGRYGEAEPLYQRALAIREQQLGADHPDTALSLNNLAALYDTTGR